MTYYIILGLVALATYVAGVIMGYIYRETCVDGKLTFNFRDPEKPPVMVEFDKIPMTKYTTLKVEYLEAEIIPFEQIKKEKDNEENSDN